MNPQILITLISTSGAVIVGIAGMWISTQQLGKRLDDVVARILALERDMKDLTGAVNDLDKRLIKVEIKLGIQP